MNKTLILAFAIAVASFGCADEEVASVTTTDGTVAPAESVENVAVESGKSGTVESDDVVALTVKETEDAANDMVDAVDENLEEASDTVASIDVNEVVDTTTETITAQVDQTTDSVNDTVSSIDSAINDSVNDITFENIDTDLDGVITEAEAEMNPSLENVFTKLDLDQNGDLSKAEFKQYAMLTK